MRNIRFRFWGKENKHMYNDVEFSLYHRATGNFVSNVDKAMKTMNFEEIEIMQSTGLPDKHGKEIYEGDILRALVKGHIVVAPMIWHRGKAQFGLDANIDFEAPSHIEVDVKTYGDVPEIIGNIYQNPELLA